MITVHHLNNSRSQRILWLLEELNTPYEIESYSRDKITNLAPETLKKIHPLGKSPVISEDGKIIIESGAITTYIVDKYAPKGFAPSPEDSDYYNYLELIHYAEGSAMLPLLLLLYSSFLGDAAKPLHERIFSEINNHISFLSERLGDDDFFFRNTFSGEDPMLSFVFEGAQISESLQPFPNLISILERYHERPPYKVALEKGGEYNLGWGEKTILDTSR